MKITDLKLENLGLKLFLFFIALCPIFYDPYKFIGPGTLRLNQTQFFELGTTILFAVILLENIYLSLFIVWSVYLYAYYGFPSIGGNYVINIFFAAILYQIAYKIFNEENVHLFFKTVIGICFLNAVWIFLQYLNIDPIFQRNGVYTVDKVGLMGIKAFMGIFFALSIPFMARYNVYLSGLFFIPIFISECSVAMVAGATVFLFHVWFQSKKAFCWLLAVFAVLCSLYIVNDSKADMFRDRFSVWKISLRDAFKHPLTGWGLDSFYHAGSFKPFYYMKNNLTKESQSVSLKALDVYRETGSFPPMDGFIKTGDTLDQWEHPHNEFISLFYEFGIIGIIILGFLLADILRRFYPTRNAIAFMGFFIGILICSVGQYPFHVVRIAYLAVIVLGIYYKLTDLDKDREEIYG